MASNQALPGSSTSGVSSPSESPWQVQHKEKVISLCLARFPQLFAGWCSASKQSLGRVVAFIHITYGNVLTIIGSYTIF